MKAHNDFHRGPITVEIKSWEKGFANNFSASAVFAQTAPQCGLRLAGLAIKPLVLGNDGEFRRDTAALEELAVTGEGDLSVENRGLCPPVDRTVSDSLRSARPTHPYFGRMTPWNGRS